MGSATGSATGAALGSALDRLRGSAFVAAAAWGQRRAPYLDPAEISARRDARVRALVRYAAETVPHYREVFRARGIDPASIRCADDLVRLPFVDKDDLRADPQRFVSESRRGRDAVVFQTSGTTGLRLRIHHDRGSLLTNIAASERDRAVMTAALGRRVAYRELVLGYAGNTRAKVQAFNRAHTFLPIRPDRRMVALDQSFAAVVDEIDDYRPDVLFGYGSYLEALFRRIAATGLAVHRPRLVVFGGEAMSDEGQAFVSRAVGAPVHSRYNAVEAFQIGFSCEAQRGYHLHEDLCHLRVVDAEGRDAAAGESGEIVISNLVNRGTVLLNYRIGDSGELSDERCPCGRTLRLLGRLRGRIEDVVYLAPERFVHPRVIWGALKPFPEILRFQLVQRERLRFELSLMTLDAASYSAVSGRAAGALRALLEPAKIETVRAAELGFGEARKFRPVVALGPP